MSESDKTTNQLRNLIHSKIQAHEDAIANYRKWIKQNQDAIINHAQAIDDLRSQLKSLK